jgi:hypothetical protein
MRDLSKPLAPTFGNPIKKVVKKIKNIVYNTADRAKGYTTQKGGTTTTTKERSSMRRYDKGKDSTKVTKTKAVSKNKDGSYNLTKTKSKVKGVRTYGKPVKTKTSTKTISGKRAAKVIKKGQKRQYGEETLRQSGI